MTTRPWLTYAGAEVTEFGICRRDVGAKDKPMPPLGEGDRIALLNAGGYGPSMSSNPACGAFSEVLLGG